MAATRRRRVAVARDPKPGSGPAQVNGLYVHASPPRVVAVNSGAVRQWLRGGDLDKLQQLVLDGHGTRLVGEYSPDVRVRAFIRWLPSGLNKVDAAHAAAAAGQVAKLESSLGAGRASQGGGAGARLPLALCKDRAGAGLLHKAVFRGHRLVVDWLLDNHPNTVHLKDREGRTALHYCGACEDADGMWQRLVDAGADVGAKDNFGRTADYYLENGDELRLPTSPQRPAESRGKTTDSLVVKPANIRIWIHDRDMGKLQQLLWEGHGARLRNETSKYPIVKRFLDGVPFVMGAIKDVHTTAVNGDTEAFLSRTGDPVPREILTSKDSNGLTPLHKAAGLGHAEIVEDILQRASNAVSVTDAEGRTPLHFASLSRDGGEVYNKLVRAGADELAQDHLGRTPEYYKNKPGDLDASLLRMIPEAPRTSAAYPPGWDWNVISDPAGRVFNGRRNYENGDSGSSRDEDIVTPGRPPSGQGSSTASAGVRSGEDGPAGGQGVAGDEGAGGGDGVASQENDAGNGEGSSLRDGVSGDNLAQDDVGTNQEAPEAAEVSSEAADESSGAANESSGAANETAGAANETAGAANETAGAANETAGAANETAGAANETAGAANETAGAADDSAVTADVSSGGADESSGADAPEDDVVAEVGEGESGATDVNIVGDGDDQQEQEEKAEDDGEGSGNEKEEDKEEDDETGNENEMEEERDEQEDGRESERESEREADEAREEEGKEEREEREENEEAETEADNEIGDEEEQDEDESRRNEDISSGAAEAAVEATTETQEVQDETEQDETEQDETEQDETEQDEAGDDDETGQNEAEQDETAKDGTEKDETAKDDAEQDETEQDETAQDETELEEEEEKKDEEGVGESESSVNSQSGQQGGTGSAVNQDGGDGVVEDAGAVDGREDEQDEQDEQEATDGEERKESEDTDNNEGTGEEGGGENLTNDSRETGESNEGDAEAEEEVDLDNLDVEVGRVAYFVSDPDADGERGEVDGGEDGEVDGVEDGDGGGEEAGGGDGGGEEPPPMPQQETEGDSSNDESSPTPPQSAGTGQSAASTVALSGTPDDPEPEPTPPQPDIPTHFEPEPEPDENTEARGAFRTRPATPLPQATAMANAEQGEDEEDEDEGVGADDDDPREPDQMTEAELDSHVARGDLGVLADLVLNGEGDRLLSKNSDNPEVQSFLDHVPTYMSKIGAVHNAARRGNLRALQAALDRRKFAVARDRRSASACTPLHVAVLLGQTPVVRYLAGRFPETLSARDLRGRTPLHYAAVLADNGHYYNLLLNLGANRSLKDKSGRNAEFYRQQPTTLTHRQLLADIGEPESIADEMFSDKVSNDGVSSRRDVHDPDAMAMMDRCFRLLRDAATPKEGDAPKEADGVRRAHSIAYRDLREVPEVPPDRARGETAVVFRFLHRHSFDMCKSTLTRMDHSILNVLWPVFLDQQKQATNGQEQGTNNNGNPYASRTHDSFMDEAGIVAPDLESYSVFAAIMHPVIKYVNGLDPHAALRDHPPSQFFEIAPTMRTTQSVDEGRLAAAAGSGAEAGDDDETPATQSALVRMVSDGGPLGPLHGLDLDPGGRVVLRTVVQVARNLRDVRLPLDLTSVQLAEVEDTLRRALLAMESRRGGAATAQQERRRGGAATAQQERRQSRRLSQAPAPEDSSAAEYFSLPDLPAFAKERLRRVRLWPYIPRVSEGDEDRLRRLHGRVWPEGRGVFISGDPSVASLVVWVNVHDHVRVMAASADGRGGILGDVYRRAAECVQALQRAGCHFERDPKLGFLLARPWDVGCGLRFQVTARLGVLGREPDQLASLCKSRGLRLRRTLHPEVFLLSNKQVLGVPEYQVYRDFMTAMANIIQLEQRAVNRSFQLSAVLSRVFKKRPSVL